MKTRSTDYGLFDEVVVDRIVAGRPIGAPIAAPDAAEATRRLAGQGYTDGQIAVRLGMARRSILRIRARLGIAAALPFGHNQYDRRHDAPSRPRKAG